MIVILASPVSDGNKLEDFIETCVRDRCALIAVYGPGSEALHDHIDDLLLYDPRTLHLLEDEAREITTTWHPDLADAMQLAREWDGGVHHLREVTL